MILFVYQNGLLLAFYTNFFLLKNNLCELTTSTHKFKRLNITRFEILVKFFDIQRFGMANSINTHFRLKFAQEFVTLNKC